MKSSNKTRPLSTLISISILLFLSCSTNMNSLAVKPAELISETPGNKLLKSLPKPEKQIVTAVYNFTDQTGQFKSTTTGPSNSKAVSQGTTSMLIKALLDSDWFIVIEREGLNNLINERKILEISNMSKEPQSPVPPLLFADVLIEGGVIAYESNILTGGAGARFLGIGSSVQYRLDEVTVYLRAVSTRNGQVLKSIQTKKSIYSYGQDTGVYKYVDAKEILELEVGFSMNEPPQTCVLEAIEKGVHSLILEGIIEGYWNTDDDQKSVDSAIQNYRDERTVSSDMNSNAKELSRERKLGVGINAGFESYIGDFATPDMEWFVNGELKYYFIPHLSAMVTAGTGVISTTGQFSTSLLNFGTGLEYTILPDKKFTPFISLVFNAINFRIQDKNGNILVRTDDFFGWKPAITSSLGIQYNLNQSFSIKSQFQFTYTFTDQLDGVISGNLPDNYWTIGLGCNYYF